MGPGPLASASSENLLEMKIIRPHPRPTELETGVFLMNTKVRTTGIGMHICRSVSNRNLLLEILFIKWWVIR